MRVHHYALAGSALLALVAFGAPSNVQAMPNVPTNSVSQAQSDIVKVHSRNKRHRHYRHRRHGKYGYWRGYPRRYGWRRDYRRHYYYPYRYRRPGVSLYFSF